MTAPSLTVGDSVREICTVCGDVNARFCLNCGGIGYVYRGVYDEQRSGEMRPELGPEDFLPASHVPALLLPVATVEKWQRIAALARVVEDPTNSEPLRQLLAAIKEAAR